MGGQYKTEQRCLMLILVTVVLAMTTFANECDGCDAGAIHLQL